MSVALTLLDYQYFYAYAMSDVCLWMGDGNKEERKKKRYGILARN
jgi:hypothetical protein